MTRINTNMASLLSRNALNQNQGELASAMQRLSTGLRINSAKDDAAGLAISEHMASQIRGLNMAMRNANDGVSLVQTSDGATQEIANMLQRMRELALQSLNDTSTASDRAALDTEYQALKKQMAQINSDTTWNGVHVLNPQQSLRASVVPASISGKGPTDTSSPASGTYSLFINGVDVPVELVRNEDPSVRNQRIVNAVNLSFGFHGVNARTSPVGGVELYTKDGADLSAWFNASVPGLNAVNFGLGSPAVAQVSEITLSEATQDLPLVTQTTTYLEMTGLGQSGEQMTLNQVATPSIAAGEFSIVNGAFYRGNGVKAELVGRVDTVKNGLNGSPLRINFTPSFENGNFDSGVAGSGVIPGWTSYNQRVRLRQSEGDLAPDLIAGFPTPVDTRLPVSGTGETQSMAGNNFSTLLTASNLPPDSKLGVVMSSSGLTIDSFGVAHGPYLVSNDPVQLNAGDTVSFDWKAMQVVGGDDYDVYAYLLNVNTGATVELLNDTGKITNWVTTTQAVSAAGAYKFVFVSGTYDASGGRAAGATLYIDNVTVNSSSVLFTPTASDLLAIKAKVNYVNQTPFTATVTINGQAMTSAASTSATQAADSLQTLIAQKISSGNISQVTLSRVGNTLRLTSATPGIPFTTTLASVSSATKSIAVNPITDNAVQSSQINGIVGARVDSVGGTLATGVKLTQKMLDDAAVLKLHVGANENQFIQLHLPDFGVKGDVLHALTWDTDSDEMLKAQARQALQAGDVQSDQGFSKSQLLERSNANEALNRIDTAQESIATQRATMGAVINRLLAASDNLSNVAQNTTESRSRIRDADYARESGELARAQIVEQAATAMLAQANVNTRTVLSLLDGG